MENQKVKTQSGNNSQPEISYSGTKSFAVDPIIEHDYFIPEMISNSNFIYEMKPEVRDKLKHLSGKGVLLSGFSGTGKTFLVKYLAKQNNALIIPVEKDDSIGIMKAKFKEARDLEKSGKKVYVVFDEIDEFGSKESLNSDVSKISHLLRELDGINSSDKSENNKNVYYFATTNDLPKVDQRLLRPGRLEELIEIPAEVVISTNGTCYKKIPKQVQIQISMFSLNPNLYKEMTNGSNLEKVKSNILKYLNDEHEILINMPVYEKNVNEINELSDYADSLGIPLRVNPIFQSNGYSINSDLEKKIENSVFELKLKGRKIIYSKNKQPVERYFLKC